MTEKINGQTCNDRMGHKKRDHFGLLCKPRDDRKGCHCDGRQAFVSRQAPIIPSLRGASATKQSRREGCHERRDSKGIKVDLREVCQMEWKILQLP